jgi:hypothetical protein
MNYDTSIVQPGEMEDDPEYAEWVNARIEADREHMGNLGDEEIAEFVELE